jgi:hypothetical protein
MIVRWDVKMSSNPPKAEGNWGATAGTNRFSFYHEKVNGGCLGNTAEPHGKCHDDATKIHPTGRPHA